MWDHHRVLKHTFALPDVLGTGMIIRSEKAISQPSQTLIQQAINYFEDVLSRFRPHSLVTQMSQFNNGGSFQFPQWCIPLFESYDTMALLSAGTFDPCVGSDLIELGYDSNQSFQRRDGADQRLGAIHGRATWLADVSRTGSVLTTHRPLMLDFGACGKGFSVDLVRGLLDAAWSGALSGDELLANTVSESFPMKGVLADPKVPASQSNGLPGPDHVPASQPNSLPADGERFVTSSTNHIPADQAAIADHVCALAVHTAATTPAHVGPALVIDAGGDLFVRMPQAMPIALEDPTDLSQAVGRVLVANASVCASAPSRRHWQSGTVQLHHLLNAITGLPIDSLQASWVTTPTTSPFSTMQADGLATALFTVPADVLAQKFHFDCALLGTDHRASATSHFPGTFTTRP